MKDICHICNREYELRSEAGAGVCDSCRVEGHEPKREATHEITACYFPGKGEVDLTWKDLKTRQIACLTSKVTPAEGNAIADVVWPCVYHDAVTTTKFGNETRSLDPALTQDEQKEVIGGLANRLLRELPSATVRSATVGIACDVEKIPPEADSKYLRTRPGKRLYIDLRIVLEKPKT